MQKETEGLDWEVLIWFETPSMISASQTLPPSGTVLRPAVWPDGLPPADWREFLEYDGTDREKALEQAKEIANDGEYWLLW